MTHLVPSQAPSGCVVVPPSPLAAFTRHADSELADSARSTPISISDGELSASSSFTKGSGSSGRIQAFVRMRPFSTKELQAESKSVVRMRGEDVAVLDPKTNYTPRATFKCTATFDSCSSPASSQQELYQTVGLQLLDNAFDGYNACLLAYGQTGSGKTYTMMGGPGTDMGLTPRLCLDLFARIEARRAVQERYSCTVEVMYYEIYNEKIFDLLAPKSKTPSAPIKVRLSPQRGPIAYGLSSHCVASAEDILKLLKRGNERRSTACTDLNDQSSRSHADFMLRFTQVTVDEEAGQQGARAREDQQHHPPGGPCWERAGAGHQCQRQAV
eukprot:GGOE01054157.1.p1 GENE.GGOE01054157.1~~GGOE01054157.1.p1  ORF type:complete len:340 (-),score=80.05 GGOE01054157.1:130-1113(-)